MSQTETGVAPRAGGRPRNSELDEAVLAATWNMMNDGGYNSVSLNAVARAAGTSRPAIYRRWSGVPALVLASLGRHLEATVAPNTGCTLCDIAESFQVFLTTYRTIRPEDLGALYADCATVPELRAQYLSAIVEPARRAVGDTLDRASARGDLRHGIDRDLLLDLVGALVHYRAMLGKHLNDTDAEHALQLLLRGAARDYDELLAHAEEMGHRQPNQHSTQHASGSPTRSLAHEHRQSSAGVPAADRTH